MTKVSVIVPVYNVENYIEKCLKSLEKQTLEDIEIIIVNDGSTDKSTDIVKRYIENCPKMFSYYEKENGGLSSARNYGLKFAKGEYIAFLDADDYVEKEMYEEMYMLAKKENADIVECDFLWEYGTKQIKDKRRKYKNKREMLRKPRVVVWNKIYKREIIEKNILRFPENLIYEDLEFFYKIMPYVNRISYINKFFVHYLQRKESIANTYSSRTADILKILQNIFDFYKEKNLYNEYKCELKGMSRRILMGSSLKRIIKIKDAKLRRKLLLKTVLFLIRR